MATSKAVKMTALATLKGNWGNAISMAMIPFSASALTYLIGSILNLPLGNFSVIIMLGLSVFVCSPLWLGALHCYWRMANGCTDRVSQVFCYFSDWSAYKRALSFAVRMSVLLIGGILVLNLPAIAVDFFTSEGFYELIGVATPLWVLNLNFIAGILKFIAITAAIAYVMCLYLPSFVFAVREDLGARECIAEGLRIGRFTKNSFSTYVFSFLGWIFLSMLFIPTLFTVPYMLMSYTVACRFGVAGYNKIVQDSVKIPTHEVVF